MAGPQRILRVSGGRCGRRYDYAVRSTPSYDRHLAIEAANPLDERGIAWLITGTYSSLFTEAIHQWQRAHGADHSQQTMLALFPPGVPELPASMMSRRRQDS